MYDALAPYYDLVHSSLTADLDYILELAEHVGGPVLELGCGTGRLLLPLARRGLTVTGVDNSPAMLARASKRLQQEVPGVQQRVDLREADMKNLSLKRANGYFSLVLLPYNTLLHFQTVEIRQLLRHISPYLARDGQLFIDIANPFLIDQMPPVSDKSLENVLHDPQTGKTVRQFSQSWLQESEQCLRTQWIFETAGQETPDPQRTVIEIDYWYHYPHQLELLLLHSNFRIRQMMGNYQGSPFNETSERLLILARHA